MPKKPAASSKPKTPKRRTAKAANGKPNGKAPGAVKRAAAKTRAKLFPKRPALKTTAAGKRLLQQPQRLWYKPWSWRHRPPVPHYKPLSKARVIFWRVLQQMWRHKNLFLGIVAVYGVLDLILVHGLVGGADVRPVKDALDTAFHGATGKIMTSLVSLSYLVASSGASTSTTSAIYEGILVLVCSLAYIWALRQTLADKTVRVRDSFYRGMYPLVPFLLIFLLLSIQLLPFAAAGGLFTIDAEGGIAVHWYEHAVFWTLEILLVLWSLRMITATLFAFYIVTLPDMTPLRAYRNARQLVYGRRLLLWRKLIFIPVVLLLIVGLVEIPIILWVTSLASWTFFIVTMIILPLLHGYMYNLYREML